MHSWVTGLALTTAASISEALQVCIYAIDIQCSIAALDALIRNEDDLLQCPPTRLAVLGASRLSLRIPADMLGARIRSYTRAKKEVRY